MKISEPIFIRKTEKRGYEIAGSIEGYGDVRRYGRSREEAMEKFFEACDGSKPLRRGGADKGSLTVRLLDS